MSEEKQKQIEALGRLGWSLRRIEQATGVRRETASAYRKAAGIGVRPGSMGAQNPAHEMITDSALAEAAQPANEVITDNAVFYEG